MPDRRLLIAAACAVLVAGVYFLPGMLGPSTATYIEQLFTIRNDFHNLRVRQAPPADWSEFAERVTSDLAPVIEDLEISASSASVDGQARQALLLAARDYFPAMLQDSRERFGPNSRMFDFQLSRALELKDMEVPRTLVESQAEDPHDHEEHDDSTEK